MFKWFSKKEQALEALSLSEIGTDLHSHLIPGIDDGANDMETSILLIKKFIDLGFKKIITTPHIMSDLYQNTPEIINSGLSKLKKELKKQEIDIIVEVAAEYYVDYNFEQNIGVENFMTFGENNILIEFSFLEAPRNMYDIIFKLQLEGYKIVLAHPARYRYFSLNDYSALIERGVFFQLNLLSLIGYYSNEVKLNAELLINNNLISYVGTDCHNKHHAQLYHKCESMKSWHQLVNSGKLLNDKL